MLKPSTTKLNGRRPVTLQQIAEKADVSPAAVSKALSGRPDIAPRTRARIKKIAQEMGYTVNIAARTLAMNRTMTLGVIVPFPKNPTVVDRLRGIQAAALEKDYLTIMSFHDGQHADELKQIGLMTKRVDGLIISPVSQTQDVAVALERLNVPVVCMSEPLLGVETDFVGGDERMGGRLLAEHLVRQGCQRLAYFGAFISVYSDQAVLQGIRDVLSDSPRKLAFLGENTTWENTTREQTVKNLNKVLEGESKPDAILSFCDQTSFWIYRELAARGCKVPQDIALCGYDNNEISDIAAIPLTSVSQPNYEVGRQAGRLLIERLSDVKAGSACRRVVYSPELIARMSTAREK
ncbi:MAG: LacI family transcriptional regulator [Planctomycetes bacterium]|nr:LacI family transcriptional regulator [Planctomycetota bacterium]